MRPEEKPHLADLSFDKEAHKFTFRGSEVASVTRVIRDQGMSPFGGGAGPAIITEKMQVGIWIHDMLRMYFLGTLAINGLSPAMRMILEAVQGWEKSEGISHPIPERPLVHSFYWYAGIPDLVAWSGRRKWYCVVDWKWGVADPSYKVQIGGYVELVRDCYLTNNQQIVGIPVYLKDLLRGEMPKALAGRDLMAATSEFLAANGVHRWRAANGRLPKIEEEAADDWE